MTKFTVFLAAMAAAGSLAGSAAADTPLSATLQTPQASASEITAGGVVWSCKADACVAESVTDGVDARDACKGLAREVGVLAKFDSLDAAALTKCNLVARR